MREQPTQVAEALARVCADEPQIRARLERAGDPSPLDRLIAAVRDGGEVSERLDEVHAALQRCGDALGMFGHSRGGEVFGSALPVGMGNPRPVEVVFLCPRGTCSRTWRPDPVASPSAPPPCQVHGEALRWERL
jgi:hypothetical protein